MLVDKFRDAWGMCHVWERSVYRILAGKRGGWGPLGRPRHRRDDTITRWEMVTVLALSIF
jgi:hypothetical protein